MPRIDHTETSLKHQVRMLVAHECVKISGPRKLDVKVDHGFSQNDIQLLFTHYAVNAPGPLIILGRFLFKAVKINSLKFYEIEPQD